MLRCLIDSMVFDAIVADGTAMALVDRLTSLRELELLAADETIAEVAATPDREHRRDLQRVRVLVAAPPELDPGDDVFRAMLGSTGVSWDDARIAITAAAHGVPLVTEDRDLRLAAAAHLSSLALWTWAGDLRPRLLALGEAVERASRW